MNKETKSLGRGVAKTEIGAASFPGLKDLISDQEMDLPGVSTGKSVTGLGEYEKLFDKPPTGDKFEWVEECPVEGLFTVPEMWKKENIKSHVFDMSTSKDLDLYSKILNKADKLDPTLVILDEQKQFCQTIENWKVFITTADIVYKKIIK